MRIIFVAFICCMQVTIAASQIRISVDYDNTPLFEVLRDLQKKLGTYDDEGMRYDPCFDHAKRVTYHAKRELLDTVLENVFRGQRLEPTYVYGFLGTRARTVSGIVKDENGTPQPGVNVYGDERKFTVTRPDGTFEMLMAACDSFFVFTGKNLEPHTELINGQTYLKITMKIRRDDMEEQKVYYNGYQRLPKERVTGAISALGGDETKRQVFTNVMDAIEGRLPGVSFNKNLLSWKNQAAQNVRVAATIHAASSPLIVINNFPVSSGLELDGLNLQDISSFTVLKDAAATSIWGCRAGNGVIIINTKTGNYNRPAQVFVSNSMMVTSKTNVRYMPALTSDEYIDMEQALYDVNYNGLSPVVDILRSNKTPDQKKLLLDELRTRDVLKDVENFFYRYPVTHRHFASISGGTENVGYYLSAGYDGEQLSLVTANRKRFTTNAAVRVKKKKFEIGVNNYFSFEVKKNNRPAPLVLYPFSQLKDSAGDPAAEFATINQHVKDSMEKYLQSWAYRPLEELYARTLTQKNTFYRLGFTAGYSILDGLDVSLLYQHDQGKSETDDMNSAASYEARNLVNSFARVKNGSVNYIIPKGGFLDWQLSEYRADRIRTQLNYKSRNWKGFEWVALAGFESGALQMDTTSFRYYGYYGDKRRPVLDFSTPYVQSYDSTKTASIPQVDKTSSAFDGFVSWYGNAAFNYSSRYTISLSARLDRSNLFGAKTNGKKIPLWSIGGKWDAWKEKFYPLKDVVPYLSFHSSWGYSGNVDKSTTALISAEPSQTAQGTIYSIINPANLSLRWEKSRMFNLGFSLADNRHYSLYFDYFRRKSFDLLGPGKLDPLTGASFLWGNFSEMKGKGFELTLETDHDLGAFRMQNRLLVSHATNKVTRYYNVTDKAGYFVDNRYLHPRQDYPLYSIFAFKWAGLDSATGDPVGYLDGQKSTNYESIINAPAATLVNKGSAVPTVYSTLQPQLSWRRWKFSFTLLGKFGYFFRRSSINFSDPYSVTLMGKDDFSRRWQKPGQATDVPSMPTSANARRNLFYTYSEPLVEKGDQIRLQDLRLEYDFKKNLPKAWKIHSLVAYIYAANLGVIWSANKLNIDPDFLLGPPVPKSITTGFSFNF